MDRRTLLKLLTFHALLAPLTVHAKSQKQAKRKLLLIELNGGNDGLNTVIPYRNSLYYKYRPTIAIDKNSVLPLDNTLALHPSLKEIREIFDQKEVAIIQGIGYPNPNRSHFRSIEIWDTASSSDTYLENGWIHSLDFPVIEHMKGVVLGGELGPLSGMSEGVIKINHLQSFLQRSKSVKTHAIPKSHNEALLHVLKTEAEIRRSALMLQKHLNPKTKMPYAFKQTPFGKQMQVAAQILNSELYVPVIKVKLGLFDTHFSQLRKHADLLKMLSENISVMRKTLIESGAWENTVIMTYSEFGRRVEENASRGTDHGTAAPHFVLGGGVKGGLYGATPSLETLDENGDLIHTTDFRSLYHTVQKEWFQTTSPLLKSYPTLPIFRS